MQLRGTLMLCSISHYFPLFASRGKVCVVVVVVLT